VVVLPGEATEERPATPAALEGTAVEATALDATAPEAMAPETATPETPATGSRLLRTALGLLLAALLLAAAHQVRPTPYGDHFTAHARGEHATAPERATAPRLRTHGATVEAYDGRTGELRWTHAREGRRPLTVLPARGEAITLWDDGLVTDTARGAVRWHRAIPDAAGRLAAHGGAGVLRALDRGMLAVVTPERITAYRIADGDLRWVLPARRGCAFEPARAMRHGTALLVAQPCPESAWTAQLIAVDDLGRITPHRTPLGNERHSPEHPHTGKVVAPPR
jgi:hypothetical protein